MGAPRRLRTATRRARVLRAGGIGLLVGLALLGLRETRAVETIELKLVDARTQAFLGTRAPDPRIVISQVVDEDVAIVEKSLAISWPWDLDFNAKLFDVMAEAGVAAVLIDVLQLDRGAGPDEIQEGEVLEPHEEARRQGEAYMAEEFGDALRRVDKAALAFELTRNPQHELPVRIKPAKARLADVRTGRVVVKPRPFGDGANLPVRRVLEGAKRLGFANVVHDPDAVVRRMHTIGFWRGQPVPSLATATAELASGATLALAGPSAVEIGDVRQPVMPGGSFLVNFRGEAFRTYPEVSPSLIFEWYDTWQKSGTFPQAARDALSGKIVLWGVSLSGQKDIKPTPISEEMFGVELHAHSLDNLLHGDGRVMAPIARSRFLLLGFAVLVAIACGWWPGLWRSVLCAFVAGVAWTAFAYLAFRGGTAYDLFTPLAAVFLAWGGTAAARLLTEGRQNRWLEGTFSRYLSPAVIDSLKADPERLELGGHTREITVLFSDVAGFTRVSEQLGAQQLVALMNDYLSEHCAVVLNDGGVVDKFIGDAVMAFYGDPLPADDHALRACRTALGVQARIEALRPDWSARGIPPLRVRFGINTGPAVVGNMGSRQRFSYTAMGDTVNLASRLEGANDAFRTDILIGPETYDAAKEHIVAKPLADLVVKGRQEPAAVYELLALRASAPDDVVAHAAAFAVAHEAAQTGDLEGARTALDEAARLRPDDGPVAWFRGVLDELTPGRPWSGQRVLQRK